MRRGLLDTLVADAVRNPAVEPHKMAAPSNESRLTVAHQRHIRYKHRCRHIDRVAFYQTVPTPWRSRDLMDSWHWRLPIGNNLASAETIHFDERSDGVTSLLKIRNTQLGMVQYFTQWQFVDCNITLGRFMACRSNVNLSRVTKQAYDWYDVTKHMKLKLIKNVNLSQNFNV